MKRKFSMSNLSIKRRIWVAISLVTLIPVIIFLYHTYGYLISGWAALVLALVVFLGWWIVFEVFSSIVRVYSRSRAALQNIGEDTPSIPDEVQSLETVISLLSDKVKSGFEQLKDFTKMTEELNKEVSRKVLILSTILQANDLFSKETPAEEVIKFLTNHLKGLLGVEICFCDLKEDLSSSLKTIAVIGTDYNNVGEFVGKREKEIIKMRRLVVVDKDNKPAHYTEWAKELNLKNLAAIPVLTKGQPIGIVVVGRDDEDFVFSKDDTDVLNLFSQNVTLIWEHERLSSKIDELEILDYLTGLYNERMVIKRLNEEIRRAMSYQRPCGFITVSLSNYEEYQKQHGTIEAERTLKRIAKGFKTNLRPIDIAGRIGPNKLGAILIESNRRQSKETSEKLKEILKEIGGPDVKLSFGVAESPLNGTDAQELIMFAENHSE